MTFNIVFVFQLSFEYLVPIGTILLQYLNVVKLLEQYAPHIIKINKMFGLKRLKYNFKKIKHLQRLFLLYVELVALMFRSHLLR
jgi:hypothetical protein